MALLVGSRKFNTTATTGVGAQSNFSGSSTTIVPEVEAKLGAMYTYAMAQGDLSLDVGWMWINYFHASQAAVGVATTKEADFALQGPFIGLKWLGNVV
jgi:hypothetical protein